MSQFRINTAQQQLGWCSIVPALCLLLFAACSASTRAQSKDDSATQSTSTTAVVPKDWHVVTSSDGRVRIAFPGKPSIHKSMMGQFPSEEHEFIDAGARFSMLTLDISSDRHTKRSVELLKAMAGSADNEVYKTIKTDEVSWRDKTVVEVSFHAIDESDKTTGALRCFYHEDLLVVLMKISPQVGGTTQRETDTFFSSFSDNVEAEKTVKSSSGVNRPGMGNAQDSRAAAIANPRDGQNKIANANDSGQKLTQEVIHGLLKAKSDVDFLLASEAVDWENVDADLASFVVDLWLTAEDMTSRVMLMNAIDDASISVLRLHDSLSDPSVTTWYRRRKIRSFFAAYYGEQTESLRTVVGLEARTKHLVTEIGGTAAPALASVGRSTMIEEIGDTAIKPLTKSAEDEKSPHHLPAYFMLRELFPQSNVTPLPVKKLLTIAKRKSHPFRENAIGDLVKLGHTSTLIAEYSKNRRKPHQRQYEQDFVEKRRAKLNAIQDTIANWNMEVWRNAGNIMEKGIVHDSLFVYFSDQHDNVAAEKEFKLAVREFELADKMLQVTVKDEREMEWIRDFRQLNMNCFASLLQSKGLHQKAIEKYRESFALDNRNLDAAKGIATSMMILKQYDAAAKQFTLAEAVHEKNFDSRYGDYGLHSRESIELISQRIEALKMLGRTDEIKTAESNIVWHLLRAF